MRGFRERTEVDDVVRLLEERVRPLAEEAVALVEAAARVLARDIVSDVDVPGFDRAAMDGYALRGSETFGAGPYNPLELVVVGEVFPGRPFAGIVRPGQAVRIMTGAPLPEGTDAVLQAEAAEEVPGPPPLVRVTDAVPPGRHVGRIGEDVRAGTIVLRAGRRLRPQDLGVLSSVGVASVPVVRQPCVGILITGNELLPAGSRPEGYRIVDSNSVMLAALVRRDGGNPCLSALVPDVYEDIRSALRGALENGANAVLISGGSSVGQEDHAPRVLAELGELSVHGIALRPASPAGVGFVEGRPVFLMPGNPVSCLCAYDLFAGRAVRRLGGRSSDLPYRSAVLPLGRKITSAVGRVDYVRVVVQDGKVEPLATSGASVLTSTTRADGFVLVPRDSEGHPPGDSVRVYFYDL
ncbi:MAG: molybdopterin molybdotransferase MoeA [Planctomycetes bacterium]|nr:molybdopterin molybdotransferase MoeA [Planctomycetota bacterium]